jgi:hypothetical protein
VLWLDNRYRVQGVRSNAFLNQEDDLGCMLVHETLLQQKPTCLLRD